MFTNSNKQNNLINILKGTCIIFIITTHVTWSETARNHLVFPYVINMAVPIFMIISGYVYTLSFRRQNITCLSAAYSPANIVNKILRYTIPFTIAYLIELIYYTATTPTKLTINSCMEWIFCFFQGGIGPGSYYYPILIQFIFLFPVLYFIVKKNNRKGLIICFAINAIYEFLQRAYGMDANLYRLLIFRYIFVISAGCYMASESPKPNPKIGFLLSLIGITFIAAITYWGYSPKIIIYWTNTSLIACLYIIPIIFLLITKVQNCHFAPLEIIGKASYNIFLTQLTWYTVGSWYVEKFIDNTFILWGINLLVCITAGLIFYFIETPITKRIIKKLYASPNLNSNHTHRL
ncbi:MAG: acyltransferase [Lachnospiraceae bacterium]|nr:acyltransferase [Lachnospiraceae bacterium]